VPAASSVEARAHASYYAVQMNWRLDLAVFTRALFVVAFGMPYSQAHEWFARTAGPANAEMRQAH